ncbi:TonB-dependent receptor, partial [Sphingobium sp.]|uniref:TonB-dependent receptor n=1 Tax=Sphingobium sp. TaxID=1912891 RepID=UPI002BD5CF3D
MKSLKIALACSASLGGVCGSSVALAQAAPAKETTSQSNPTSSAGIEDIVVTAQRRSERTQDIPVAISAFGGAQLERTGTVSLQSVANKVPSVYFGSFGALRPQLYIRGIGTRSFDPGSESSVGIFEDEVYLGRSSGSFGSIRDVERIEVLRGPQGTLYGRNTIGGAVNVITKAPTEDFHAELQGGISNFDGRDIFGAV